MLRSDTPVTLPGPVLALDLGGTHLRTALTRPDGTFTARRKRRTPLGQGASATIDAVVEMLDASRAEARASGGEEPIALGISAPGPLNPRTGTMVDPPNMGPTFRDLPLAPRIAEVLDLPWALERDTQVAVLAERWLGAGRSFDDLVYLTVSTGIGGGVISAGQLLGGPDGVAGELGHLTVDLDGPVCGCGARGHLEVMSSGSGIARQAREAVDSGEDAHGLRDIAARIAPEPLEAVHVAEAAEAGDPVATWIIDRARRAFASAVVSIVDVFNPDRVIVGGGIAIAWGERLLGPAREAVQRTSYRIQRERARIVPAALGDDVGLIGAVPLVLMAHPELAVQADRIARSPEPALNRH
jgi:glucokinase